LQGAKSCAWIAITPTTALMYKPKSTDGKPIGAF